MFADKRWSIFFALWASNVGLDQKLLDMLKKKLRLVHAQALHLGMWEFGSQYLTGCVFDFFPVPVTSGERQVKRLWCAADMLVVLGVSWVVLNGIMSCFRLVESFSVFFSFLFSLFASNMSIPTF